MILNIVVTERDLDRTLGSPSRCRHEPGRENDRTICWPRPETVRDRQIQIGPCHSQPIVDDIEAYSGQHGKSPSATGGSPPRGCEGIGQDLTLATELHSAALPLERCVTRQWW